MIDNIKFYITNKDEFENDLESKESISFQKKLDIKTGEIYPYPKIAKYYNLEIRITQHQASIGGSLHKCYNEIFGNGSHNHNDFSFQQLKMVLNKIYLDLNIQPHLTKVTNLEFGFNIELEVKAEDFIKNHLLMYDFKDHNTRHEFKGKGLLKEFQKSDFSLKVYDKSKQFKISDRNLLRIEQKITSSRYLKNLGLVTLCELTLPTITDLFSRLLKNYDKLLIVDSIIPPGNLLDYQQNLYKNCTNPNHILALPINDRVLLLKDFNRLIKKYELNQTHLELKKKIIDKYRELKK